MLVHSGNMTWARCDNEERSEVEGGLWLRLAIKLALPPGKPVGGDRPTDHNEFTRG